MKIHQSSKFKDTIIRKLLSTVYRLEGIGNSDINKNGERNFVFQLAEYYSGQPFILFDVGANKGDYTAEVLQAFFKPSASFEGHLFEPVKETFAKLQLRFKYSPRLTINNCGASDNDRTDVIYLDRKNDNLASLYHRDLNYYHIQLGEQETVKLIKLSDYIRDHRLSRINLLKLDVEGHELNVLKGLGDYLNSEFVDFIQFEYGGTNLDSHNNLIDYYNLLEQKGFTICGIVPGSLEVKAYDPRLENFVYRNYVAVSRRILNQLLQ